MEWISVEDKLPDVFSGKFKVRIKNENEMCAFFYSDALGWIAFYGQKTSYWWDSNYPHERLDNVTHWMPLSEKSVSK